MVATGQSVEKFKWYHTFSRLCILDLTVFMVSASPRTDSIRKTHTAHRITHHSRRFPEEVVLAEDGDEEANKAFNCHGNESPSHNVPLEWGLHLVKLA